MSESKPVFDSDKYKRTQHDQWNEDAAAWHRWGPTLQDWFGSVTKIMLDLAQIAPGQHVLDIAAGAGEPALSAAERVGPQGYVLATDLSENIIRFAQKNADDRHLASFHSQAMDGENLELPDASFDVVLCRFGLTYMPNRQRALAEWHRVLKPGGRAVVAVYSTPDKNGWGQCLSGSFANVRNFLRHCPANQVPSAWVVRVFWKAHTAKPISKTFKPVSFRLRCECPPRLSVFSLSVSHLELSIK